MINLCYLWVVQPFEEIKVTRLEIMNELCNFLLLYHVIMFSGMVPESEDRYMLGWSFIGVVISNLLVHMSLLVIETYNNIRVTCKRKYKCCRKPGEEVEEDESVKSSKKNLSVIEEEEEDESLESNFSHKPRGERMRARKLTDSDWDTQRMGGSEGGFDIG